MQMVKAYTKGISLLNISHTISKSLSLLEKNSSTIRQNPFVSKKSRTLVRWMRYSSNLKVSCRLPIVCRVGSGYRTSIGAYHISPTCVSLLQYDYMTTIIVCALATVDVGSRCWTQGVLIKFQYGGSMPLFLCWTPNIESNVLETPNIVGYIWGPNAGRHQLNRWLEWIGWS